MVSLPNHIARAYSLTIFSDRAATSEPFLLRLLWDGVGRYCVVSGGGRSALPSMLRIAAPSLLVRERKSRCNEPGSYLHRLRVRHAKELATAPFVHTLFQTD